MTTPLSIRTLGSAVSDLRKNKAGATFDAGPGNDLVLGSSLADDLKGGSGRDALFGFGGADALEGGAGLDLAVGGAGNDTFLFHPGDLATLRGRSNGYGGLVDTVLDFRGAGTSGTGEQDVLCLEGFGAGATLSFMGTGPSRSLQLYEVVDPSTPGGDDFVLLTMADGTRRPTAGDGAGGFGDGSDLEVGGGYSQVALGDLDGDGDLVTLQNFGEGEGDTVSVRLNDGDGTFGGGSEVAVDAGEVAPGDLDGPARLTPLGLPDLGPSVPTPAEIDAAWA